MNAPEPSDDFMGLSQALYALGQRVKVRPSQKRVKLSVDDFDLVWRATIQLGRYFKADMAVEWGTISFDLHNQAAQELSDALEALDKDVLELIGWSGELTDWEKELLFGEEPE